MAGQFGVDTAKRVAVDLAKTLSILSRVFHGSIVSALDLIPVVQELRRLDLNALKSEILELDAEDRKAVEDSFASVLDLQNKDLQAKILQGEAALENAFVLVGKVLELVNEFKALLGA